MNIYNPNPISLAILIYISQRDFDSLFLCSWSFVLEAEASAEVIAQADGPTGYGRVKDAPHWLAVPGANWRHPHGPDSTVTDMDNYPVVQVSHKDATEYCKWTGRRLPTEKEWEYASRGGLVNRSYPWGKQFKPNHMNIWDGKFPQANKKIDGYLGVAPTLSYSPNKYGVYNTVGNVWEWVSGGSAEKRIQRGGSYIDSADGSFNHPALVSTRQENTGDSAGSNSGFRCASSVVKVKPVPTESDSPTAGAGVPPDSLDRSKGKSKKGGLKNRVGKAGQEL